MWWSLERPLAERSYWCCRPIAAGGGLLSERPVYFGTYGESIVPGATALMRIPSST